MVWCMNRRILSAFLCLFLTMYMAVIGYIDNNTKDIRIEGELPEINSQVTVAEAVPKEVNRDYYSYNDNFRDLLATYLSQFTFVSVQQTMSTSMTSDFSDPSYIYSIDCDFDKKRVHMIIETNTAFNSSSEERFEDFVADINLVKEGDTWVEAKNYTKTINFDISDYDSVYDFYTFLSEGFTLNNDTIGVKDDRYIIFTSSVDATSSDLQGVSYDSLGTKSVTLIFDEATFGYKPISMVISITFEIRGVEYESKTAINFLNISLASLEVPEYEEEKVEAGEFNSISENNVLEVENDN